MTAAINDGSQNPPRFRLDLNMGTLSDLPASCDAPSPKDDPDRLYAAIAEAGFEGVQGGSIEHCRKNGLASVGGGRVNAVAEATAVAKQGVDAGHEATTVHVGWGHEDDDEIDRLLGAIVQASADHDHPIFVETHRATIFQDTWRTIQAIARTPEVRINGDFSHWYTGLEMPYGDWDDKVAFIQPALERVNYFHARLGNSSHMQVRLDHPSMENAVAHFRDLWTRAMAGFKSRAQPGDILPMAPELLPSGINYAYTARQSDGTWQEDGDRWADALRAGEIAKECWAAAKG